MSNQFNPEATAAKFCHLSNFQLAKKILFLCTIMLAMPTLFALFMNNLAAFGVLASCVWITIYMSTRIYICARNPNFESLVLQTKSREEFSLLLVGGKLGKFIVGLVAFIIVFTTLIILIVAKHA